MPFDLSKLQAYTEIKEKPEKSESWDDLIESAFKTEPEKGLPQQVASGSNSQDTSAGQTKNMPAASDSWDDLISAAFKNESEMNTGSTPEATGLNDLKNRLVDFDKSNQAFLNEWDAKEKELEKVKKSFDPTKVNAVLSYLHENGGKRKQLKQEREELLSSIYNHPELIAERKEKAAELEKRMAEMDKLYDGSNVPVLGTGPGAYMMKGKKEQDAEREADRFSRAYKLYENAHDMLLAPSKFDKSNAFLNFAKGSGKVLSDKDFWTGGMSAIARNLDLGSIFKKISENKEGKDFKDLLTPGESSLLDAYYAQVNAQAERAKDLSLGYQAGQGAAQSLEYMAEFLATGGLATAASSGAKKAAMKWIIKHSAPASLKRQALKGAAWGAEAGVGTLARTPLMPSTYVNVTDPTRQFETDEKGNVLQDEAGRPVLKSGWKVFREGFVDSFIENLSEVSGGHIAGTLGVGGKIVGKVVPQGVREAFAKTGDWLAKSKPGEMYKSFSKSPVWKFLKEGGYNGLLEEWGEEWYGAALRSVLTDPSALKDYATLENQLVTVASFLPMSALGGGVATGQMLKAKGQYKQTLNALQGLMKDLGYKEDQVAYLTDQIEASDAEKMASTIAPLINTLAGENEEKAGELFTAVADFSRAKGNYHLMNGAYEERMAARKAAEDKRMEEETGGYVNSSTGRVEIVADEEGNTAYVAGESLDGDHKVYILNKGGEKISVSREDFEEGYKVQGNFDKDEFLGTIIMNRDLEEEISEEASRVEDVQETQSEDYASKVDENTAETFDSALDDGKYALLKDGRKGLIETTPGGLVADFLDGSRENITEDMIERPISDEEWLTAQEEEVQPEAEKNQYARQPEAEEVVSAISQETLPENVQQSKQIPVTDDGKPDYNAMSPEMFAEEFEKEFGPEETKAELEKMVTDVEAKIEKLHKKAPTDRNARAENKREILRLTKEKESVLQALERYIVKEEGQKDEQPFFSDEEEVVRWVIENSDDVNEVLGTYEAVKGLQGDITLPRWKQELQGVKINPESFYKESDRNLVTSELKRGWLSRDGRNIDEIAHELSDYGIEVTPQDIVDFMLENPSGHVRQKSSELDALEQRFSELATKAAGIKIGKPDSPTGKLFIKNLRTANNMDQLREQINDLQRAEEEVLRSMAEQREAERKNEEIREEDSDLFRKSITLQENEKNNSNEISEQISQGEYGAEVKENGRVEEALIELRRRSEEDGGNAQEAGRTLSGRQQKEIEARAAEDYAKEKGIWIPMQNIFSLGEPAPSGNENDVYFNSQDNSVYKVNNLMNSGSIFSLLERIKLHNQYFPDTRYELVGFSGFGGRDTYPVLRQRYVENSTFATPKEIENYMEALGFERIGDAKYSNGDVVISDLRPRNVLKDSDNDFYVVDAEFEKVRQGNSLKGKEIQSDSEESQEDVSDEVLFREKENYTLEENIEEVNRRFNQELEQQIDGKLPKGHVYQLGRPSDFLRKAGIPDLPIEMPASQLAYKSTSGKHDYDLSEVMNLPEAIANPIATFSYGDKGKSQNILTILEHNGENFLVGMFIRPTVKGKVLEVNSIRNVFPKNTDSIVKWILDGKLTNASKEKLLNFLDQQRTDYADVASVLPDEQVKQGISEVSVATNIIENFENPTFQSGEISSSNDDARYRFIGEKGAANLDKAEEATIRLDHLNVARDMEKVGKDAKAIKLATGWERGADGKWRYEMLDGTLKKGWEEKAKRVGGEKLSDVINSKDLFNAYPQLSDVEVSLESLSDGIYGRFDSRTNTIFISDRIVIGVEGVLNHEIQHVIQDIEGFARGGNPSRMDGATELEQEYATFDELVNKQFGNNSLSTLVGIVQNKEKAYQNFRNSFGKSWDDFFEKLDGLYNTVGDTYFKENYDYYVKKGKKGTAFERYERLSGEVESRNVESRMNMTSEERRNSLASETEDVAREDQIFLNDALGVSASMESNKIEDINGRFNEELQQQINGTLPKGHVYQLGKPSNALKRAGIPDLPIEMASARLLHKSNQENHPFDLSEVGNLPNAVQYPIAVFRSATHVGSNVILTELKQRNKNFVVAIQTNKDKGRIQINDIRSIHPRTTSNIVNWINEGLMDYANIENLKEWLSDKIKTKDYLNSSNPAEVRKSLVSATNIIQNFENPTILEGEILAGIDQLSEDLRVPVKKVQSRKDLPEGIQRQMKNGRYPGLFDPKVGEVYMVMDEITDVADAQATMLHEIVGHKGIRGLFGDKIGAFTQRVLDSMPENEREMWVKKYNGNEQLAAEEYVARFAEGYENPGVWEKIKAVVRELFRDLGIDLKLSDNDLKYILWKAKNKLKEGDGMVEIAEKIAKDRNIVRELWRKEDKEKGLDWISSVNPNELQEISNQDLSSATNIIQNFENPKLGDEIRFREVNEEEGGKNKETAERISLLSKLQSQLLNERVSAKLIARKLAGYARNAFNKDLVEVMGKKDFDTVVREIERGLLESKLPKESVELTDERKRLIQEYWKNLGDKEISGKAAKRIREIDREVNRMAKEALWEPMMRIGDVVAGLELKRQKERLDRLVNLKVEGMNAQGVSVAKKVDEETKVMLHFIRDHIGEDMAGIIEELERNRDEAEVGTRRFDKKDEATLKAAMTLQQFFASDNSHEVIAACEGRIKELKEDIKELEVQIEEEKQEKTPDKRLLARLRRKVKNKKQEIRYSAFTVIDDRYKLSQKMIKLNDLVEEMIYEGRSSFLDRVNEESIRRTEILREAMRDMDTRTEEEKMNPIDREKTRSNKAMDFIRKYPLSPAWSFNYLVKHLSRNAMNGEGEFYDRLFRGEDGLLEASAKEWKGIQKFRAELDKKVKEIFGKKYDYLKVMEESGKMLEGISLTVDTGTGGEYKFSPTLGQALYITMIDRMPDAAQKLRAYGISDENVMDLRNALPEQYVKFADWVQDDFLPRKREKYNETHVRIFGSSMAEISHYFPLRVQKSDVYQKADLNKSPDVGLPSGITGSIINRKPNWLIPDVHTNAFEVLLDHGKEMEHWNAYTRVVHDLNGVLSSTAFRKMLKDRDENLPERFRSAATIAVGKYRAKDDDWNRLINTVAKGFTAAKINFRVNTALKQVFSGPAFMAYAADMDYQKRLAHCFMPDMWKENWKWGMENLPVFEKRWKERKVGNEKLEDGTWIDKFTNSKGIKAGMWLNAAIDAMTCVNGARAVYDYKLKQYRSLGIRETEAVRRARIDAELAFNESQQSAEGFMLSKMQKDKTVLVAGLSVFNNSNFLYLRQTLEGVDELRRDMAKEVASRKRLLIKLGVEDEVAEDVALKEVKRMHRTAIAKIGVFGFGLQVIWNLGSKAVPYLTALMVLGFGDDDKEKEEAREVLRNAGDEMLKSLLIAPVRNLPGGSDIESMLNGFEASFGDLPMFSDLAKLMKMYKKCIDSGELTPATIYETFRMAGEGAAGVDLNVLANLYLGIEDAVKNGGVRVEDTGLWISAPASQIRELAKRRRADETLEEYIKRIRDLNVANRLLNRTPAWLKGELKDRYRLTPFQRAKKDVKQDVKRKINQVNRNESLSPAEKKVKRESLRKERDKQMEKLEEKYDVVR